ncbi:MAG: hypothetical protein A2913_02025 [Parcubacteria group bacterium RIFCSPLOWO2_01_FULL_40_65]|nr:MAG: hypothetical protein A2734_00930 [Parcubacteria group bacterium RIFCSPHIGHO2_01_FULL_40_30]OHB19454.1 MAG: hypothetical protein A3D40_00785 [Parcubacteria group bacterium RIFCSPHIGHO2_02_FULL_40_12]OHB21607.1 MAG: hypothetical protein A2913_02025 [Parcubacteria group bacterium RIFCSPLOWO2_01_FULL_40_65]OHB23531.1 MAG: hypothetical protein A3I22_01605 [Parcubacteria group bacterium RIFCSPLOWO2_02_FULL_40_12]OHB23712.1 MAG: hypothetical protein A3F96_01025 [Parcubacteria group bacterium R
MKSTKTVTVLVLVGTGSRYETKDINGISHFLEHMMFKGTTKRPNAIDISRELDSIGAEYNAFTSKEYTGYYAKSSNENLELITDVVSDIFLNSKLDAEEIEREKGVITEEINMYLDDPPRHVGELFETLLYGDQPSGWNIAGEKEIIQKLTRNNFVNYFDSHYVAKDTIIAVAGNVDKEKVRDELIPKFFKGSRIGDKLDRFPISESQDKPEIIIKYKKTDQTHFILGVRAYDIFSPKKEAAQVLSVILGGGMSSRLFISVRERQGLAYYISSSLDLYTDHGYLGTQSGVNNGKAEKAIETVLKEYKNIKDNLVPEEEIKKAKEFIKGRLVISLEQSDDLASFYANQWLLKDETLTPEEKLSKIMAVTADEVQAVAKEIFKPEKLNLALIGPFEDKEKFEKLLEI